jgi:hypothetical protein
VGLQWIGASKFVNRSDSSSESHRMIFRGGERIIKKQFPLLCVCEEKKTLKLLKYCFLGVINYLRIIAFRVGPWNLTPLPSEG